eukprot:GHRR01013386.1.p1 GENE.GHRR01013386.1~~GHRR01013386.1.p1  ORF type:complete len:188 (+),score=52.39 GHRR01013386.1:312-875(+)
MVTANDKERRSSCPGRKSCVFCHVIQEASTSSSRVLYQDETVIALPDKSPAAAQHLLVIPRTHIPNVNSLTAADSQLVRHMLAIGQHLLQKQAQPPGQLQQQQRRWTRVMCCSRQQLTQYKYGFHKPPFRSIDHLHLHCFELPHKWYRWVQYQSSLNWITAEELNDKLARLPSEPSSQVPSSSSGSS